jgi:hypothetical protein
MYGRIVMTLAGFLVHEGEEVEAGEKHRKIEGKIM